jgi:hypothetical protein
MNTLFSTWMQTRLPCNYIYEYLKLPFHCLFGGISSSMNSLKLSKQNSCFLDFYSIFLVDPNNEFSISLKFSSNQFRAYILDNLFFWANFLEYFIGSHIRIPQ